MEEPIWIDKPEVLIVHAMQLAEHGGSDGLRDETLLDSALAKPRNVFAYADSVSLPRLAASYAFGIARNHAFIDGNKRTAFMTACVFLRRNGFRIKPRHDEAVSLMVELARGIVRSSEGVAEWFRNRSESVG